MNIFDLIAIDLRARLKDYQTHVVFSVATGRITVREPLIEMVFADWPAYFDSDLISSHGRIWIHVE